MTGPYDVSLGGSRQKRRQGPIFFVVVILHAAILYGLCVHKPQQILRNTETRIDLIWVRPPEPAIIEPAPVQPQPEKPVAASPKANRRPIPPQQDEKHAEPAAPVQVEANEKKPLDMQKILSEVGTTIRKLDSEQPAGRALQAEPRQPTFEEKLGKVLANATSAPKFYEGARIETISSGTELDAGIIKYKITTFAGTYCVTYKDGARIYIGTCPIKY